MAKSINPRIIVEEETDKKYQFNREALKEIIHSRTDRKNHITQHSILLQLEEQCGLTVARVSKWLSGANGPGNIDNVKDISEFFGIDYHDILIDMNPVKEDEKMINSEEKTIIKTVFGECVTVLYKVNEITNFPKVTGKEMREYRQKNVMEIDLLIQNIHRLVDQNSISLKKYNRYNLHRILLELNECMYGVIESEHNSIPERWDEINDMLTIEEIINFPTMHNRDNYLKSNDLYDTNIYLVDEISLVEEMGLSNCIYPTDEEWDTLDEIEDCSRFGYIPNTDRYSLTPSIIWIDLMITVLTNIFETDFPNVFEGR